MTVDHVVEEDLGVDEVVDGKEAVAARDPVDDVRASTRRRDLFDFVDEI